VAEADAPPILTHAGVPTGGAEVTTIGPSGGEIASGDGRLKIKVPAGAVTKSTDFSIQPITHSALGGVGSAYRLRPEGALASPVTITLKGPAFYEQGTSLDDLGIAYQDASGFWFRMKGVARDAKANTLTVSTSHFSDWGVVWTAGTPGMYGTFTLQQTVGVPFSGSGTATLFYQGSNSTKTLYILTGSMQVPASFPYGGLTCGPDQPTSTLQPTVAEVWNSPAAQFRWAINDQWSLACTDPVGVAQPEFMAATFDTLGLNLVGCARGYVGTPLLGTDHLTGKYTIDCGANGSITATWDFVPCVPGVACTGPNPCHTAVIACDTGQPVCTDTGSNVANGQTCGTNEVCYNGTCNACTAAATCTTNPDPACHLGATDCTTGQPLCQNAAPLPNGTSCGTNLVCNAGACASCTAGVACTTNPDTLCHDGATSCATGTSACVDGAAKANGTTCGTNQVCNTGACVSCTANVACTGQPDAICHVGVTNCSTGTSTCVNGAALSNGTACGSNLVCDNGACVACTAGAACTTNPDPLCHNGVTSCATGASACVDASVKANGTTCGANLVCNGGLCNACTAGLACTPANACDVGVTDCSTGTQTCKDTGTPVANGASCGTNEVCNGGVCNACTAGLACTPANACDVGVTDCSAGTQTCKDTGTPVANGTVCGTGLACNAGVCACDAGAACASADACHTAAYVCTTGSPVCTDNGNVPDGTTCGPNEVCSAGVCSACTVGASCTPPNLCHVGSQTCSAGPACNDTGASVANGTPCGPNDVCDNGACSLCNAGITCRPPADPCHVGSSTCDTGTNVCVATTTAVPDGTSCGNGTTCTVGACTCNAAVACTPTGDPCHVGATTCDPTTGAASCTATSQAVPDGTSCGNGQTCTAGTCACSAGAACQPTNPCHVGSTTCDPTTGAASCVDSGSNVADGTSCGNGMVCRAGTCG